MVNKTLKRTAGAFALVGVVGVTAFAPWALRSTSAVSSSDVVVGVHIEGAGPSAIIEYPPDDLLTTNLPGTIQVHYENIGEVLAYVQVPGDPTRHLISEYFPSDNSATFSVDWANSSDPAVRALYQANLGNYGQYIFSLDIVDKKGNLLTDVNQVTISYRAVSTEVMSGPSNGFDLLRIHMAPGVCRVGIQVFAEGDASRSNPLLNPTYVIDDFSAYPTYPDYIDVSFGAFADELDPELNYQVMTTAYDCSGNQIGQDTVIFYGPGGDGIGGEIPVPNTGALSMFGLTVTKLDYIVSGVIAAIAIVVFAVFVVRRQTRRR